MISRRTLLGNALLAVPALRSVAADRDRANLALVELERRHGGHLGVAILDTGGAVPIAHRGDERFPMCSTFKWLAAAFMLARVDRRQERLDRRIVYTRSDLLAYSPVTELHVADGMTIGALCEAAVTRSDNAAANLMLGTCGGPAALTAWLRTIGDPVTRLDRLEPMLNEARPGDPRDTTTPLAMMRSLQAVVLGTVLTNASRELLTNWLVGCTTGGRRLRAALPPDWRAGDKTGTGSRNTTNDVAVFWPPGRQPIIVVAYYVGSPAPSNERESVLADVGRVAIA